MSLSLLLFALSYSASSQTNFKPIVVKFYYDGHIYIKCKINDTLEANLLFDTGANGLLLDEDYFNSTGIPIVRSQLSQLPGAGSTPQTITVVLDRMVVNLDTIKFVPPYVPLMKLRCIVGEKADGIIGPDFLLPYFTRIDFTKKKIMLYTNEDITKGYESIKLDVLNHRFYLPIEVSTKEGILIKGNSQLDLGYGGTLNLTSPTGIKYQLEKKVKNIARYFNDRGGAGGRIEGFAFRASTIKIGKYKISMPDVDVSTDTAGALSKSNHIGLLGNSILERFDIIVNFKTGVFYCKPNGKLKNSFSSNLTGFFYVNNSNTENALVINGLFKGGNAEKAGVKVQDKILAINGVKVSLLSTKDIKKLFKKKEKTLKLTILSGLEKKTLKLELKESI